MFIIALFTIAKLWKQWNKKMWYLYTMEFYSASKNEILSFASKWMELENIILSEVTQAQNAKNQCSPSYEDYRAETNGVILLDMGYTLRGKHGRNKEREGNENLNVVDVLNV
jgi:hypothetical protein